MHHFADADCVRMLVRKYCYSTTADDAVCSASSAPHHNLPPPDRNISNNDVRQTALVLPDFLRLCATTLFEVATAANHLSPIVVLLRTQPCSQPSGNGGRFPDILHLFRIRILEFPVAVQGKPRFYRASAHYARY